MTNKVFLNLARVLTLMESKGRVFRPHGALMVFPCIGSDTQVTICPALRTALIRWGSLTLMFSAPILVIIVILPALFCGFKISMSLTNALGSILSLTCNTKSHKPPNSTFKERKKRNYRRFKVQHCSHLNTERVGNSSQELNMGTIQLPGSLSNPKEMSRAIIVKARSWIPAC